TTGGRAARIIRPGVVRERGVVIGGSRREILMQKAVAGPGRIRLVHHEKAIQRTSWERPDLSPDERPGEIRCAGIGPGQEQRLAVRMSDEVLHRIWWNLIRRLIQPAPNMMLIVRCGAVPDG